MKKFSISKIGLTFCSFLFVIQLYGQERTDSLEIQMNRRWKLNQDSIQLFIKTQYSNEWNSKIIAIYLDKSGVWHGKMTTTISAENTNYELTPKSNWNKVSRFIERQKILLMPPRNKLKGYRFSTCLHCKVQRISYKNISEENSVSYRKKLKYWLRNKSVRQAKRIVQIEKMFNKSMIKYGT